MLPLIVFSLLFGFAVNLNGGKDTVVGKWLDDLANVMMKFVKIVTLLRSHRLLRLLCQPGGHLRPPDHRRPMAGRCWSTIPSVPSMSSRPSRSSPLRAASAAPARCSPYPPACHGVPGHLLLRRHHPHQYGSGRGHRHLQGRLRYSAAPGRDHAYGRLCFSCVLKIAFVFGVFGVPFEGIGMLVKVVLVAVLSSVGMSGVPGGGYIGEYIICSIFFPTQMSWPSHPRNHRQPGGPPGDHD